MSESNERELTDRAAQQHGVFTRNQARYSGLSDTAVTERAGSGRYRQVAPGVYAVAGAPSSVHQRMAAAVLSFPGLAAVSHQTAAEIWGLTQRGWRQIEVVTTRWDRVRREGVRVHESLDLVPHDVVRRDGLPVTSPVRTIVDLGASNRWIVEAAFEQGIRLGLFSLGDVESMIARVGRRGRRGVGVIRPLVEARRRWDTTTESPLEDEFRKLLAANDCARPVPQYVVRNEVGGFVCRADFAYPDARVLIELDSEAHHLDRITFRRDRSKQNSAVMLGWTMLRYTWWDLTEQPYRVLAEVRAALAATE